MIDEKIKKIRFSTDPLDSALREIAIEISSKKDCANRDIETAKKLFKKNNNREELIQRVSQGIATSQMCVWLEDKFSHLFPTKFNRVEIKGKI